MSVKTLEKKSDKELLKELDENRAKIREFRFGMTGSKTRNTKEGQNARKAIARIMTEMRSRQNNIA